MIFIASISTLSQIGREAFAVAVNNRTHQYSDPLDCLRLLAHKGAMASQLENCHALHSLLERGGVVASDAPIAVKGAALYQTLAKVARSTSDVNVQAAGDLLGLYEKSPKKLKTDRQSDAAQRLKCTTRTIRTNEAAYLRQLLHAFVDLLHPSEISEPSPIPSNYGKTADAVKDDNSGTVHERLHWRRLLMTVRRHLFSPLGKIYLVLINVSVAFSIFIPSDLFNIFPATSWYPMQVVEVVFDFLVVSLWIFWLCLIERKPKTGSKTSLWRYSTAKLLILTLALFPFIAVKRFDRYLQETRNSSDLAGRARQSPLLLNLEFSNGDCDSVRELGRPIFAPLMSCGHTNGQLIAGMASESSRVMGIYPVRDTKYNTYNTISPHPSLKYYTETRFRPAVATNRSSCGILIEASGPEEKPGSIYFHIVQDYQRQGSRYHGEALDIYLLPDWKREKEGYFSSFPHDEPQWFPSKTLVKGTDSLPFVGERSFPRWEYADWTKLAVLIFGDVYVFFVNGRVALTGQYPGLNRVHRTTLAVIAGTVNSGGNAVCEFDYLRVSGPLIG